MGVLALSILGCASTPIPTSSAKDVPRSRVLNPVLLEQREGFGQVVVKRDSLPLPNSCKFRVLVDGIPLADLSVGEKVVFYLPEGDHLLGAVALGICIGSLVEVKATVTRLNASIFRISLTSLSGYSIQPTAF
jgi:hypothetical protein